MNTQELKPCPFCGDHPSVEYNGWQDENRYVEMQLKCCVTMSDSIGWWKARDMQEAQRREELWKSLAEKWNTRYVETNDGE